MLHVLNMSNTSPAMPCTLPLCTWMCLQVPCGYPTIQPVPPSLQQGEEVVEELVGQGRAFLAQLRAELDLDTPLEAVEPQWAPEELSGTPALSREPRDPGVLGLMWQHGVLLPDDSVPGQCSPAMSPLGFSYLSWWQGLHQGRNVSWCLRSSQGWRRRRQVWAEVSTLQPLATVRCHVPVWGQ